MPDFLLPDLGEGLEDAEVLTWLVRVGDKVRVDQPVVEVETAKAAVEVPVPFEGTVTRLHAQPGTVLRVGSPLISVSEPAVAASPEPGVGLREPGVETSGNVLVGYGTTEEVHSGRRRRGGRRRVPASSSPAAAAAAHAAVLPGPHAAAARGPIRVISPLVRKLARDAGLDLRTVAGTGPDGLIRRADVEGALAGVSPAPALGTSASPAPALGVSVSQAPALGGSGSPALGGSSAPALGAVPSPALGAPGAGTPGGERRIPLRGVRRAAAEKLARSRREIPEATVWVDVDATDFLAARAVLGVSVVALLARFALVGLRRYPELNARIDGDEIVIPEHVHLGFAAQTERGLVVPVVRDAHRMSTRELSTALAARTDAARAGTLSPADLSGGTFTVNNYGVFGVDGSAAIINHPEVAILGMGRLIDRPWVVDGTLTVRKVGQLTLAFDHRVCDGGVAGGFLRHVADRVESPVSALGDL
ncbi:hypothetical protein Val02_52930 [Virgisporangium aliadipatigenens]|uniref:Dihydrolipoamide acetyltransferase component of pyruvate dehydrogenase complex n=1 Tax=Virgisporangium aliadipatigenens TaxID=741659 RepID=A0A8J3YPW7_9ACTN|nr:dihydrolipoamide acetyltransferase family protein [Virgisporangium aliadipatigenens]GIJ48407.1 hypothetical protein Val02_52930 [Virgisporangium aliadipatigenens]